MRTIWKYPISLAGYQGASFPVGTVFLHFGLQDDVPTLWVLLDPDEKRQEYRRFRLVGTGNPIDEDGELVHIGTVVGHEGQFVWHLFEVKP